MLEVSLRARRHTTQVMLGLSLRARWDTKSSIIIIPILKCVYRAYIYICYLKIPGLNSNVGLLMFLRCIQGV